MIEGLPDDGVEVIQADEFCPYDFVVLIDARRYGDAWSTSKYWKKLIGTCLARCDELGMNSVSFPACGTGAGKQYSTDSSLRLNGCCHVVR